MPLLQIKDLKKFYPVKGGILRHTVGHVKAVNGVSFDMEDGETLGIVGESGSGKTTLGRTVMRLLKPSSGKILFQGREISTLNRRQLRSTRRDMQMVFQDPFASLNQRMTVGRLIEEPLLVHTEHKHKQRLEKVKELLDVVGLSPDIINRYPHEFSGGQRQRIGIARALAIHPKLIVADEPVSALDVSIQSQVMNLMMDLQEEFGLSYLFIAHDLSVVKHISDRVGVMYLGEISELASKNELFRNPLHPYTQSLLSAIPSTDSRTKRERIVLQGDIPNAVNLPSGCPFHTRCPQAMDKCSKVKPEYKEVSPNHYVACHLY